MISYEELLEEIIGKSGISREEVEDMVKDKHRELSGLVSLQGAAHLVARDLGITVTVKKRELKISDLKDGMRSVDIKARVTLITEAREFSRKDGTQGKVSNIFITDGTGDIRAPLWDKQVDYFNENFTHGDVISIKNALAKVNNIGNLELRVSNFSTIEKVKDDGSIPMESSRPRQIASRIDLKDLTEGFHSARGNIVHLFNINFTYKMCPECRMKIEGKKCPEHGKVKPETNMIVSAIVDDGTNNIRVVFFREQAEKVSGLNPETLADLGKDDAYKMLKEAVLGKDVVISGRIQRNKMFENLEMVVNDVQEINPVEEGKRLISEIKSLS